ncbi:MAG: recombinase family protein [Thermodesulfobacteriota bacterium]|nr:recombinase family protein [Thermodesulfobacteriota bacterium]
MQLRFAPLVRVSTEGQEKRGESLQTQIKQIEQYVDMLDGRIPQHCWKYSGQEHATPDQERHKLDQLLEDAPKNLFDAVIVVEPSRWSRDNAKSKAGLEILRNHNIRFFTGTIEQNLYDPTHILLLGMSAEIGEYQARMQTLKSIQNRIERAKRGLPVSGKLPYGRTFNKKTEKWGVDIRKAKDIRWAAKQYLAGKSIPETAKTLNMKKWHLWKVLRHSCGDTWEQRFRSPKLNIDETVPTSIPPLLPKGTIKAIAERAEANKTYSHGHLKHFYLLSRMVFCNRCGYAMFGQANRHGTLYYRHAHDERIKKCDKSIWVRADQLEDAVIAHIYYMLGDATGIEEAVNRAVPDFAGVDKLEHDKEHFESKQKDVKRKLDRLVEAVLDGTLTDDVVKAKRTKLEEQQTAIQAELEAINGQLEQIQTKKSMRMRAAVLARQMAIKRSYRGYRHFGKMSREAKRKLAQSVLGGKDSTGKRLGVYIDKDEDGTVTYTIHGNLPETVQGSLPMKESEQDWLLDWDPEIGSRHQDREKDGLDSGSKRELTRQEGRRAKDKTKLADYLPGPTLP